MENIQKIAAKIFQPLSQPSFSNLALTIFRLQARRCVVYNNYLSLLGKDPEQINAIDDIPFLPIDFFKNHRIQLEGQTTEVIFSSSGTTGSRTSTHYVSDARLYIQSFRQAFQQVYGPLGNMAILALLPSYKEREGSSLIYMVDDLIRQSNQAESGYFLYNHAELRQTLLQLKKNGTRTILFGVTYALLDFIENDQLNFPDLIVIETGGMKGQRKEIIREELHHRLAMGFGTRHTHSEYGMTELLSQAYLTDDKKFTPTQWMQVRIRDINDPLTLLPAGKTGGINVIDLANINSCSFIATQDLGRLHPDGSFDVLGRFDHSDIRGCNLLVG